MLDALVVILYVLGAALALPTCVMFAQIVASLFWRPKQSASSSVHARPQVTILIPAHDEDQNIACCMLSVSRQLTAQDRVVVVADNCCDRTAEIAAAHGADVTIRTDPSLRGKGHALNHGIRYIERTGSPEVVIIVDADCEVTDGCIELLAQSCSQSQRPAQASFYMIPSDRSKRMASLATFARWVKVYVRPLGWLRLGLPCSLSGSGMAFPWDVLQRCDVATGSIVEDLKLGLDLALKGHFPIFCPEALVVSKAISDSARMYQQRTRWEHGSIETKIHYLPRMLKKVVQTRSIPLLFLMLDTAVPPLAVLFLALAAYTTVTLLLFEYKISVGLAALDLALNVMLFTSAFFAWLRYGQGIISFVTLLYAPLYVAYKIPIYVLYLFRRQRHWKKVSVK